MLQFATMSIIADRECEVEVGSPAVVRVLQPTLEDHHLAVESSVLRRIDTVGRLAAMRFSGSKNGEAASLLLRSSRRRGRCAQPIRPAASTQTCLACLETAVPAPTQACA